MAPFDLKKCFGKCLNANMAIITILYRVNYIMTSSLRNHIIDDYVISYTQYSNRLLEVVFPA